MRTSNQVETSDEGPASVAAITALTRDTRAFPRLRKAANSLRSRRDGARRLCHRMDTTLDRLASFKNHRETPKGCHTKV